MRRWAHGPHLSYLFRSERRNVILKSYHSNQATKLIHRVTVKVQKRDLIKIFIASAAGCTLARWPTDLTRRYIRENYVRKPPAPEGTWREVDTDVPEGR